MGFFFLSNKIYLLLFLIKFFLKDGIRIFKESIEIASADKINEGIIVTCYVHGSELNYSGGNLFLVCNEINIYDHNKNKITLDFLKEIREEKRTIKIDTQQDNEKSGDGYIQQIIIIDDPIGMAVIQRIVQIRINARINQFRDIRRRFHTDCLYK